MDMLFWIIIILLALTNIRLSSLEKDICEIKLRIKNILFLDMDIHRLRKEVAELTELINDERANS